MAINKDLQWQAESDADTMARYQEIISDKARLRRATTAAKKQATNLTKRVNNLNKVASTKGRK